MTQALELTTTDLAARFEERTGTRITARSAGTVLRQASSDLEGSIHAESLPAMAFALALARLDTRVSLRTSGWSGWAGAVDVPAHPWRAISHPRRLPVSRPPTSQLSADHGPLGISA